MSQNRKNPHCQEGWNDRGLMLEVLERELIFFRRRVDQHAATIAEQALTIANQEGAVADHANAVTSQAATIQEQAATSAKQAATITTLRRHVAASI